MWCLTSLQRTVSHTEPVSAITAAVLFVALVCMPALHIIPPIVCDHRANESLLAAQHYNRILKYAKCQTPFPKVVHINSELRPSAIKKYIPHCTILHVCGKHTGCCLKENEQCVPKTVEEVKLYFWTIELTPRGHKKGVEMIAMMNHTECMCAPINGNQATTTTTTVANDRNDERTSESNLEMATIIDNATESTTTSIKIAADRKHEILGTLETSQNSSTSIAERHVQKTIPKPNNNDQTS